MATTVTDTHPTFARLTEGRSTHAWRSAAPAVLVLVGVAALLVYLASALSTAENHAMGAAREANDLRGQQAAFTKRISALQDQQNLLTSPGRTTVVLQPGKDVKTETWAAATWGEQPDGKSFMRVNAYGLQTLDTGKSYHAWLLPKDGAPQDVGAIDMDPNGAGFVMQQGLPAINQGKSVELTIDSSGAKEPGEVVATADLPKLQQTLSPGAAEPAPQARPGPGSQPMHQEPGK